MDRIKRGVCSWCGRMGIIEWTAEDDRNNLLMGLFVLTSYGNKHFCSERCYARYRRKYG